MKDELQIILNKLDDIEYGFVDNNQNIYPDNLENWDNNFGLLYRLQSPNELINNKYGVCWDQVELERYYLSQQNIESKSYFIIAYDNKQEPTHTFIVVKKDKYYWLEHSWQPYRGIHEYNSIDELLYDVKEKFKKFIDDEKIVDYEIEIYEYTKPKYHLNCIEFINHCTKGRKIDIS